LNNGHPLANKCYIIYQYKINFSAECLTQDGDVLIHQIKCGKWASVMYRQHTECNPRTRFSQFR